MMYVQPVPENETFDGIYFCSPKLLTEMIHASLNPGSEVGESRYNPR